MLVLNRIQSELSRPVGFVEFELEEENGTENGTVDMDPGTAYSVNHANILSKKRKALVGGGDSDGEGEPDNKAPSHDIFRARQQKRVK